MQGFRRMKRKACVRKLQREEHKGNFQVDDKHIKVVLKCKQ